MLKKSNKIQENIKHVMETIIKAAQKKKQKKVITTIKLQRNSYSV